MKSILPALFFLPVFIFNFSLFGFGASLQADQQNQTEKQHHEVTVTATRVETPVKETASAITVIKTEDLPLSSQVQPEVLFSRVPGIFFLQTGLAGGSGSLFIRGANSEHTLFLIDGLELNDPLSPARSFNFNLFNLGLIERVEILRGPQSPLYGSDALAGVVNLISAEPEGKEILISGFAGSYRTGQANFSLRQTRNRFSYLVGFNTYNTGGISSASSAYPGNSENDGFNQHSLALKFRYLASDNFSLTWQTRALFNRTELDNFGGPYGDDPNSVQKSRFLVNRLQLNGFFFNRRWEQKLIFGMEAVNRDNENPADDFHPEESESALYKSQLFKVDWQNNLYLAANHNLVFGAEYRQEQGRSNYLYSSPWGDYESNLSRKSASLLGFYFQDQLKLWNRLSLTSGFRCDNHQNFGTALTFRIAANLDLPELGARLKSTLGTGFKAPSLYQLYAPPDYLGQIGNLELQPEKNLGWDAGFEKNISQYLLFSMTYFETHYRDLIQFYSSSGYQNVGQALSKGLESSLEAQISSSLRLTAAWTYLKAREQDTGTKLLRRPENTVFLNFQYLRQTVNVSAEFYYVSSRTDLDYSSFPSTIVTLKPTLIANLFLSYNLKEPLSLFLQINNLFNSHYEMIYGYGSPGTTISSGFRLKL
ncbi:MAG: TonB-dependent receptor [Acidobacteriota bacterium]|nr:TonB-dependent receptor [Acidobacteriota bacterium]MDW3228483.1 TonB-dependent receptor [Acidobacteriota bacterium]